MNLALKLSHPSWPRRGRAQLCLENQGGFRGASELGHEGQRGVCQELGDRGQNRHSKRSSRVEVRRHEAFPGDSKRARVLGWEVPAGEGGVKMAK